MHPHQTFAAMLCGPHQFDDRPSPQFHRLDAAAEFVAGDRSVRSLLICGDSREGNDVDAFHGIAARRIGDPSRVVPVFDPGSSTLSDVRSLLSRINATTDPGTRTRIHLFTDDWHMDRAFVMCVREAAIFIDDGRSVDIFAQYVCGGVPVTSEQRRRERDGILAYHSGAYCPNPSLAWGKPH